MLGKMPERMLGAALLNPDTFEDVEHDRGATIQAALVVILVSLAFGIGGFLNGDGDFLRGVVFGVIRGVLLWTVWALTAMLIGTTFLKTAATHADWGQVARGTGFAQTPGLLSILVFVPIAGIIIWCGALVWQLVAMTISFRQTLDYESTWRAFFVTLLSLIPALVIFGIIVWIVGIGATEPDSSGTETAILALLAG